MLFIYFYIFINLLCGDFVRRMILGLPPPPPLFTAKNTQELGAFLYFPPNIVVQWFSRKKCKNQIKGLLY